jgi:tetratricopeptide (TPR) repeat protein
LFYKNFLRIFQDRLEESAETFAKAVALDPENYLYHYGYSVILLKLQQISESFFHVEKAFQLDPSSPAVGIDYGIIYGNALLIIPAYMLGALDRWDAALDVLSRVTRYHKFIPT